MIKYKIDVEGGHLVVKGGGSKSRGGNAKFEVGGAANVRWELESDTSIEYFDLAFETLVFANGLSNPVPAWPFEKVVDKNSGATVDKVAGTATQCKWFEAEVKADPMQVKYTITARAVITATLDPIIIIEN